MNPGQDESEREGPFSYHDYDGRPNPGSVDFNGKTFLVDKGHKILGWLTPDEGPEVVELMNEAYAQGRLSLESKVKELEERWAQFNQWLREKLAQADDDGVQSDFEYVLKKMSAIEGQEGKK